MDKQNPKLPDKRPLSKEEETQSGAFAPSQADARNDGMVSAEPRNLSKHGQAPTADDEDAFGRDPNDLQSRDHQDNADRGR